jgi:hypothetical protein
MRLEMNRCKCPESLHMRMKTPPSLFIIGIRRKSVKEETGTQVVDDYWSGKARGSLVKNLSLMLHLLFNLFIRLSRNRVYIELSVHINTASVRTNSQRRHHIPLREAWRSRADSLWGYMHDCHWEDTRTTSYSHNRQIFPTIVLVRPTFY